ncbi:MAG: hypothetical protein HFH33_08440 [Eubacterium sp.]|nr:hypothetical protein [Eubacterium sp.]
MGTPLAAALEECLEALSILRGNQGRSQAAPLAAAGSELGAATVHSHSVPAEYLELLSILERTPPGGAHPLSQRPSLQKFTKAIQSYSQ